MRCLKTHTLVVALPLALAALACARRAEPPAAAAPDVAADEADFRYPKARWRLAPMELNETVLTVSHIAIRDAESKPARSLYLARPQEALGGAERSRADAFALATRVREQAMADPSSFARLARQYSDDSWTAERGGALGTVDAALLSTCFLDALAAMPEESVSKVVRCDLGYHILYKHRTAPLEHLSGQEIVLGYEGLETMELSRGEWRTRDRAATRELALRLVAQLRKQPAGFGDVAHEHSNVDSALRGGHFGNRPTHRANVRALDNAFLQRLDYGQVSDPVESHRGFVIYLRAPYEPQPRIAMEEVMLTFDPSDPAAANRAGQAAMAMLAEIQRRPEAFEQLQAQHCCADSVVEWELGSGGATLEAALSSVAVGELVPHPVQGVGAFQIVRRVAATGRGLLTARLELPQPDTVDVDALFAQAPPPKIIDATRQIREQSLAELRLEAPDAAAYEALLSAYASQLAAASPAQRAPMIDAYRKALKELLGAARFARYERFVQRWLHDDLMSAP